MAFSGLAGVSITPVALSRALPFFMTSAALSVVAILFSFVTLPVLDLLPAPGLSRDRLIRETRLSRIVSSVAALAATVLWIVGVGAICHSYATPVE